MKVLLILAAGLVSTVVSAESFTPIVTKSKETASLCPEVKTGEICQVTWNEALTFCQARGYHLPTAREYANIVRKSGTKVVEGDESPKGFYLVASVNPDGKIDNFFMNHESYKHPVQKEVYSRLWTSSTPPKHQDYAHVFYEAWGGGGGEKHEHHKSYRNAFQCVLNK